MSEIMSGLEIEAPMIWGEIGRIISVTSEQVNRYADALIFIFGATLAILVAVLIILIAVLIKKKLATNKKLRGSIDKKSSK